ncbi:hypothetical protein H0H81_003479 [Sphagnurus paluster]|uniref:Uncharacterized protein n=1 Tax=Sphagnurus paluster TaxID=117069 RepID=A0A9P7FUX2_9AGAR|nr:hypothetical protein H0H81_003479 [Sphagnurus paluster]
MTGAYSQLLKTVHSFRKRFVEHNQQAEVRALLKTITASSDIIMEQSSHNPVALLPEQGKITTQQSYSSLSSHLFLRPSPLSTVQPTPGPSIRAQECSLPISQTCIAVTNENKELDGDGLKMTQAKPGPEIPVELHSPPIAPVSHNSSLGGARVVSPKPLDISEALSPEPLSTQADVSLKLSVEPAPKPKKKKKKKKLDLGLEELIQTDLQDLCSRGTVSLDIKREAIEIDLLESTALRDGVFCSATSKTGLPIRVEAASPVIVLDQDDSRAVTQHAPEEQSNMIVDQLHSMPASPVVSSETSMKEDHELIRNYQPHSPNIPSRQDTVMSADRQGRYPSVGAVVVDVPAQLTLHVEENPVDVNMEDVQEAVVMENPSTEDNRFGLVSTLGSPRPQVPLSQIAVDTDVPNVQQPTLTNAMDVEHILPSIPANNTTVDGSQHGSSLPQAIRDGLGRLAAAAKSDIPGSGHGWATWYHTRPPNILFTASSSSPFPENVAPASKEPAPPLTSIPGPQTKPSFASSVSKITTDGADSENDSKEANITDVHSVDPTSDIASGRPPVIFESEGRRLRHKTVETPEQMISSKHDIRTPLLVDKVYSPEELKSLCGSFYFIVLLDTIFTESN